MTRITFYGTALIDGTVAVFRCTKDGAAGESRVETHYGDVRATFPNTKKGSQQAADYAASLGFERSEV